VSDFLGRMAARAVGETPRAQPRLPALFEQVEPPAGPDAGSALANEAMAPSVPPPTAVPSTSSAPHQTELAPPSALGGLGGANLAHQVSVPSRSEETRAQTAQLARPGASTDQSPDAGRATAPELDTSAATAPESASAVAVPAVPASAGPFPVTDPVHGGSEAAARFLRDDPAPVRVHIGRLEVRANLQDGAPPPQPRPADSQPQGLSLSDYLRGKREAG
jgi:hypothetical protein